MQFRQLSRLKKFLHLPILKTPSWQDADAAKFKVVEPPTTDNGVAGPDIWPIAEQILKGGYSSTTLQSDLVRIWSNTTQSHFLSSISGFAFLNFKRHHRDGHLESYN